MKLEEGINPDRLPVHHQAVSISNLMSLSVAADMATTCYNQRVKALGIHPRTSLSCPLCKNTNGLIWNLSCIIIETSSVQTASLSIQRWLSWLADWFPMTKFACPQLMVSAVDMTPGEEKACYCWKGRVGRAAWDGRADKQKAPSVFISVTLGCSVISLLHAKQSASAAEGRQRQKGKFALMATNKGLKPVTNVCVHRAGEKQKLRWAQ